MDELPHPLPPLLVEETDEYVTVGPRRRPAKKLRRNHSSESASSRTSAMDIGPSQDQQAAVLTISVAAPAAPAVGRALPLFIHRVSNVAALYGRLIAAHGLSADKRDLKLLGGARPGLSSVGSRTTAWSRPFCRLTTCNTCLLYTSRCV